MNLFTFDLRCSLEITFKWPESSPKLDRRNSSRNVSTFIDWEAKNLKIMDLISQLPHHLKLPRTHM